MNCSVCGRKMVIFEDTLLCPTCDWYQLWYMAQVSNLKKDPKAWKGFERKRNK